MQSFTIILGKSLPAKLNVSSLWENYPHCLESLQISDFAPFKFGENRHCRARLSDPVGCNTSQASLQATMRLATKFPRTARLDLSLCQKSAGSEVWGSRETFLKFVLLRVCVGEERCLVWPSALALAGSDWTVLHWVVRARPGPAPDPGLFRDNKASKRGLASCRG